MTQNYVDNPLPGHRDKTRINFEFGSESKGNCAGILASFVITEKSQAEELNYDKTSQVLEIGRSRESTASNLDLNQNNA